MQGRNVSDSALRALHGVGATIIDTPVSERYNAALQSFKQDDELQQYYIQLQENPAFFDSFDMSTLIAMQYAILNYDAAIAVGLAACNVERDLFTAAELYESILTTRFDGVSGHVSFDNETGTRSLEGIRYKVENVLASKVSDGTANFTTVVTARIDFGADNVVDFVQPFVYNDNTTIPPKALPPLDVNPNLIGTAALAIGLALGAFIMLLSIVWTIWTYLQRKQQQVRAAQAFFLSMICIGTFITASSIIPASFEEPMSEVTLDAGCMLFPWFVTIFSALFTKVRRIYDVRFICCLVS